MLKDLPRTAFTLFTHWKDTVHFYHPKRNVAILDETELVRALEDSVQGALQALMKKEKEKREDPDYDYGFFVGFIEGNLNQKWTFQYLTKGLDEYKEVMLLQALLLYLKLNDVSLVKIDHLYEHLMLSDSNLLFNDVTFSDAMLEKYRGAEALSASDKTSHTETFLYKAIETKASDLRDRRYSNYLPHLDSYFPRAEVEALIADYEANEESEE